MADIFANAHAAQRAKAEREACNSIPAAQKAEIQARVKAEQERREALARPDPAYKPRLPMRFDV